MKAEDFTGKRFGRLTVKKQFYGKKSKLYCLCLCDCGVEKVVDRSSLKDGRTQSCGCFAKDRHPIRHGLAGSRIYNIWCAMKGRCNNPNLPFYKYYGERGIKVCEEWNDFKSFYEWAMENGYHDSLTIDRIDVNGGYSPDNCRWVTMGKQSNNRCSTIYMTMDGEKRAIKEWSDILNIPRRVLYWRTTHGWDDVKALTTPVQKHKKAM